MGVPYYDTSVKSSKVDLIRLEAVLDMCAVWLIARFRRVNCGYGPSRAKDCLETVILLRLEYCVNVEKNLQKCKLLAYLSSCQSVIIRMRFMDKLA